MSLPVACIILAGNAIYWYNPEFELGDNRDYTVCSVTLLFGVQSAACSNGRLGLITTMVTGHMVNVSNLCGTFLFKGSLASEAKWKGVVSLVIIAAWLCHAGRPHELQG